MDRDSTDDITELGNPSSMNPVNPADQIAMSDGAVVIHDRSTFEALSLEKSGRGYLKFSLFSMDNRSATSLLPALKHAIRHHDRLPEAPWSVMSQIEGFARGVVDLRPDDGRRRRQPGGLPLLGSRRRLRHAQYSPDHVSRVYTLLAARHAAAYRQPGVLDTNSQRFCNSRLTCRCSGHRA